MNNGKFDHAKPKEPGLPKIAISALSIMLALIHKCSVFREVIFQVSDILRYATWLKMTFKLSFLERNRQTVWIRIADSLLENQKKMHAVEFGVAYGYLTWWWFQNYSKLIVRWDGFDSFMGLPRDWRGLKAGTFSTNGKPPDLNDSRINWHIGEIESTNTRVNCLFLKQEVPSARVIFFDLDIYEPSLIAWNKIKAELRSGDILYFDEAFDSDERRIIENEVLPFGEFHLIASSWTSLAIQLENIK